MQIQQHAANARPRREVHRRHVFGYREVADAQSSLVAPPRVPVAVGIPKPGNRPVFAKDYVEALISLVHDAPWATRSRELRALLGVKKDPFLRIVDAACGRSYLTLALGWWLAHRQHHPVEIVGFDRNPALVAECQRRSAMVGLDAVVRFEVATLGEITARQLESRSLPHKCRS